MKTNKNEWISLKEQQPGDDQFPVFYYYPNGNGISMRYAPPTEGIVTHWCPANPPAPPAKATTQAELDEEAFHIFIGDLPLTGSKFYGWRAGIAYERAEIIKIIGADRPMHERNSSFILRDIQLRVKGGAA